MMAPGRAILGLSARAEPFRQSDGTLCSPSDSLSAAPCHDDLWSGRGGHAVHESGPMPERTPTLPNPRVFCAAWGMTIRFPPSVRLREAYHNIELWKALVWSLG